MDIETGLVGGGSGILGAILAFFGVDKRLTRLENEKLDKSVCTICAKANDDRIEEIHSDIKELKDGNKDINKKLDTLLQR